MKNLFNLKDGETIWQPVLSGSMAPGFIPGDEVQILAVDSENNRDAVRPGHIALIYKDGVFYFHRVLFRLGDYVYEKGDGNYHGSWVSRKRIVGSIIGHRRKHNDEFELIPIISFSGWKVYGICLIQIMKTNRYTRFLLKLLRRVLNVSV